MSGPFRDSEPLPPETPEQTTLPGPHPFGFGKWRCPVCGAWFPSLKMTATVVQASEMGLLVQHKSHTPNGRVVGCLATWLTYGRVRMQPCPETR